MKGVADQAALALANAGLFKEVRTNQERLRRMAQRLVSVQEEERRRLSRELHDSAGQSLTALQLNLSLVGESLSVHDGDVRQGIDKVLQLAKMAYEEIRAVSHALRPPALDTVGLDQALACLRQSRILQANRGRAWVWWACGNGLNYWAERFRLSPN